MVYKLILDEKDISKILSQVFVTDGGKLEAFWKVYDEAGIMGDETRLEITLTSSSPITPIEDF